MEYRDHDLEQKLYDIVNRTGDWEKRCPNICMLAIRRIAELENGWEAIRDKADEMHRKADEMRRVALNPMED